jgi:hypothetical protein
MYGFKGLHSTQFSFFLFLVYIYIFREREREREIERESSLAYCLKLSPVAVEMNIHVGDDDVGVEKSPKKIKNEKPPRGVRKRVRVRVRVG